ncbi:MAG: hypothetical protein EYC70_10650 [Planctomycetota bacterium]|nr:MAG: hypothetical protein EYC70_10650 [Planctomycetota bacterium]
MIQLRSSHACALLGFLAALGAPAAAQELLHEVPATSTTGVPASVAGAGDGSATFSTLVPAGLQGATLYLQAYQPFRCAISPRRTVTFL